MTSGGVNDLNEECRLQQASRIYPGGGDACRQARIRPAHGVRTVAYLSSFGREVRRRLQCASGWRRSMMESGTSTSDHSSLEGCLSDTCEFEDAYGRSK